MNTLEKIKKQNRMQKMEKVVYKNLLTGKATGSKREAINQWIAGCPIEVTLPGRPKMRIVWEVD